MAPARCLQHRIDHGSEHNAGVSKIGFVTDPNGAPAWTTPAALGR